MRMTARTALLVALTALTQCTTSAMRGRGTGTDPFAGGGSGSGRVARTYEVELEVSCDRCRVTYNLGADQGQADPSRSWREQFFITPLVDVAVRLSARADEGGVVKGVRLLVDDETVAEAGCAGCDPTAERLGDAARSFTVETVVPPR